MKGNLQAERIEDGERMDEAMNILKSDLNLALTERDDFMDKHNRVVDELEQS